MGVQRISSPLFDLYTFPRTKISFRYQQLSYYDPILINYSKEELEIVICRINLVHMPATDEPAHHV
jgi:hypothetical protein